MDFSWGKHTLTLPLRNSENTSFSCMDWPGGHFLEQCPKRKKKSNLGVKKPRFQSLGNKLNLQPLCFTDKSVIKKKRPNPVMPKVTDSLDPVPS